jgi:Neocarzinostatin family
MPRFRNVRVVVIAMVMATGVMAGGPLGVSAANAKAAAHKVVVKPSVNLHNGETVTVSGSGFTPGDTVYIVECLVKAKGQAGCNTGSGIPPYATISATGTFAPMKFKVTTGKVGNGTCGTRASNLKACAVSVGNATGGDSGVGPIVFALKK